MPGFATVDAAISVAGLNGKMQRIVFSKAMAAASVIHIPHTLWKGTGTPLAGTDGTVGAANGRATSKTTVGAIDYLNDAATGELSNLASFAACSATTSGTGTLILCDRLADCNLDISQATSAITGLDATARLGATTAPGDGGQMWLEVTTVLSAASNVVFFNGTDNLGNAAIQQPGWANTASAAVHRSVNTGLWQPLASGTTGVRDLTNITLQVGAGATGAYNACIVRPLAYIPVPAVSQWVERDFICEIPLMSKIYDNACLFMIWVPSVNAITATIFGELRIIAA